MDLERIKQNLRLRSGRARKPKSTQAPPSSLQPKPAPPEGPTASSLPDIDEPKPRKKDKKEQRLPGLSEINLDSVPEHRPSLQHAATGLANASSEQAPMRRYGRSGIEKPGHRSPNAPPPLERSMTEPVNTSDNSDSADFDLRPPAPRPKPPSLETTSELLFSAGHLNALLHDPQSVARFTAFLTKYKPEFQPLILRYLETQKAIKAIEYANAIAQSSANDKAALSPGPAIAATLDKAFEEASASCFKSLVGVALPLYITYDLVKLVSECLVSEITGKQTPMMRNLVGGLSEVFCLTDPTREDNPIIYASEEFYRYTGYGRDDVIGHNCRFLQGPKTNRDSPRRIRESVDKGEEHYETLLNYRRDGRPFINLLLVAPLHDNKGKIKYFIGAQVDVTGLVIGGRALEGFERYLQLTQADRGRRKVNDPHKSKALAKLRELSEMFDLEESAVVKSHSRASSLDLDDDIRSIGSTERRQRRIFVDSDHSEQEEEEQEDEEQQKDADAWKLGQSGPSGLSGKLPGIYDSFMLVRAAPSLRIIFVSPKLQKFGNVVQNHFLAHVAAPATTLSGLKESLCTSTPVSAKINFMSKPGEQRDGTKTAPRTRLEDGKYGKTCWISATPLLGSDDRVGVWMIVVVEKSKSRRMPKTAAIEDRMNNSAHDSRPRYIEMPKRRPDQPFEMPKEQPSHAQAPETPQPSPTDLPIKPKRLEDLTNGQPNHEGPEPELRTGPGMDSEGDEDLRVESTSDAEFIQKKALPQSPHRNGRICIEPDSEEEQDNIPDWQPARGQSIPASPMVRSEPDRKYTPPPDIPESMMNAMPPPRALNSEDGATPTRTTVDEADDVEQNHNGQEEEDEYEEDSFDHQPPRRGHQPVGIPPPMDYLTYPGTNPPQKNGKDEKWIDVDCMRSPYSVD